MKRGGYLKHDFAETDFQELMIRDVIQFDRDLQILVIGQNATAKIIGYGLPNEASPEQLAQLTPRLRENYAQYMLKVGEQIRYDLRTHSDWFLSPEMLPLRERAARFPHRAIAWVVPSLTYAEGGLSSSGPTYEGLDQELVNRFGTRRRISATNHYSMLVYYVHEQSPIPNLYHYDSMRDYNVNMAMELAYRLANVARLFNSDGRYAFVQPTGTSGMGRQEQSSCATWSAAYAEKLRDGFFRANFSRLSVDTLQTMNEYCSVDLTKKTLQLLEHMSEWYWRLRSLADADAQRDWIRNRLNRLVRYDNDTDNRVRQLSQYMRDVYCVDGSAIVPSLEVFWKQSDSVQVHPDMIRMFLASHFIPDDVLFSTNLRDLSRRWLGIQHRFLTDFASGSPYVGGLDRFSTEQYYAALDEKGLILPRLLIWLWLPEFPDPADKCPILFVCRPLLSGRSDGKPSVRRNTIFTFVASDEPSPRQRKHVIEIFDQFIGAVTDWVLDDHTQPCMDVDEGELFETHVKFGRYFPLHVMEQIFRSDSDIPDSLTRLLEVQSSLERISNETLTLHELGTQQIATVVRYIKPLFTSTFSQMVRKRIYTRVLKILAGVIRMAPTDSDSNIVNLDQATCWQYSDAKIRDNRFRVEGSDEPLFDIRSDWLGRTRLRWTKMYYNNTLHAAIETALYQVLRSRKPGFSEELQAQRNKRTKLAKRLIQSCPCALRDEETGEPYVFYSWNRILDVESFLLQTPETAGTFPFTKQDFLQTPLRPVSRFCRQLQGRGLKGLLQFPVLFHGLHLNTERENFVAIDLWDMLALMNHPDFQQFTRTSALAGLYELRQRTFSEPLGLIDLSARITHHDPYLHIALPQYSEAFRRRVVDRRESHVIPSSWTLKSLLEGDFERNFTSRLMNYSVADIALLCAAYFAKTMPTVS